MRLAPGSGVGVDGRGLAECILSVGDGRRLCLSVCVSSSLFLVYGSCAVLRGCVWWLNVRIMFPSTSSGWYRLTCNNYCINIVTIVKPRRGYPFGNFVVYFLLVRVRTVMR